MTELLGAPLVFNWTLSYGCNFACSHCYSRDERCEELDLEGLKRIVDVLATHRVPFINFGGGEPLLRRDLFELTTYAAASGLRVSMNSNGWALDEAAAQRIAEAPFQSVGISLDSADPSVHDGFRAMPGSFERACRALALLEKAGVKRTMSSVICRINHERFEDLIDLAQKYGVSTLYLHNFKCSGYGFKNRERLDLSPSEWRDFYLRALRVQQGLSSPALAFDDPILASLPGYKQASMVKGSACGKLSLHLRPNGDITPCGFIPRVIGNILQDDFERIWHHSPVLAAMRHKVPQGRCGSCESFSDCLGGCSARSFAETGDFNRPDPHCWK